MGGCRGPGPGAGDGGLDRRDFLKIASASVLATLARARAAAGDERAPHQVPADKGYSREWLARLRERGEPGAYGGKALERIGMPVGGIGAGQMYLRGDGTLGGFEVFHRDYASRSEAYDHAPIGAPVDQGFAVVLETGERRLDRTGFAEVEFRGEHPIATVRYRDPGCPVRVELEAYSPFVPLEARDSALPATVFEIAVENASAKPVKAGVVGWLENAVCFHSAGSVRGRRTTAFRREERRAIAVHGAGSAPAGPGPRPARPPIVLADFEGEGYGSWRATGEAFGRGPARGTLPDQQPVSGFQGGGLVNTYLGGDGPQGKLVSPAFKVRRRYLNFLLGGGRHPGETCLDLVVGGDVVRTATGRDEEKLVWRSFDVEALEGREATIEIVDRRSGGWGHVNVDQVEMSDERREGPEPAVETLEDRGTLALALDEAAAPPGPDLEYPLAERRRAALLASPAYLAPGARRTVAFVVAWHFPNHANGHEYETRFASAEAVARHVLDRRAALGAATRAWRDAFHRESTLPCWLLERVHAPVANLATNTCQWWRNGRFWAWEGVGCCEGTCTHVWNYAQAPALLFPELERSVREMQDLGAAFHDDGLVGFRGHRNGAYAADGQAGTILKVYREHRMSADGSFLERAWPRARAALEFLLGQDADDDGLLEGRQHNTYDIDFHGPNPFVGALYLAALRAGEEMAKERAGQGGGGDAGDRDRAFAARLRAVFERGRRRSSELLFDGEYFVQRVDLRRHPRDQVGDGCLSDQLFGQLWAHLLGLGYVYPEEQVRSALRAIWRYNFAPDVGPFNAAHPPERRFASPGEAGLFICTWPRSAHLARGVRYREEVWTGIEYQVAAHLIVEGLVDEGLAIVRAVHDRYHPSKRNPYNEVECGDHYARALSSFAVLLALAGLDYHGPRGRLRFAPRVTPDRFRCAFTGAEGFGTLEQERADAGRRQVNRVALRRGRLRLRALMLQLPPGWRAARAAARLRGAAVAHEVAPADGECTLTFGEDVVIGAGETLEVELRAPD